MIVAENNYEDGLFLTCALRFAFKMNTFLPEYIIDIISENLEHLPLPILQIMRLDLDEYVTTHYYQPYVGYDYNRWKSLINSINREIKNRKA